jgi:hypothetical protein
MLFDCITESTLFDVANFPQGERTRNRLGPRDALQPNYGAANKFRLVAGSTSDIAPVNASELERRVRRAHAFDLERRQT